MTSFSLFLWTLATGCLHKISKQVANLRPSPFTIDTLGRCNVFRKSKNWTFLVMFYEIISQKCLEFFRKSNAFFPEIFGKIPKEISHLASLSCCTYCMDNCLFQAWLHGVLSGVSQGSVIGRPCFYIFIKYVSNAKTSLMTSNCILNLMLMFLIVAIFSSLRLSRL